MIAFLRQERWALALVLLLALLMQVLEYRGWLGGMEGRLLDTLLGMNPESQKPASSISLLEIDDDAYWQCFQETSPLEAGMVAALVTSIAREARPRVIGVDILTDSRKFAAQYRGLEPGLRKLSPAVVWIAGISKARLEVPSFPGWLAGTGLQTIVRPTAVLGNEPGEITDGLEWGVPVYPRDEDAGVRRFPRSVELSADPEHSSAHSEFPTWARLVAEKYCRGKCGSEEADEVLVSYSAPEPAHVPLLKLFSCPAPGRLEVRSAPEWAGFRDRARDGIVLVGGTFRSSGDFHDTARGRMSGLLFNAYAVQAEISQDGIHEAARPVAVAFDIVVGFLIVLLMPALHWAIPRIPESNRWRTRLEHNLIRWTMAGSAVLVIAAACLTWVLFGRGYLLSFLGVGIGVLLHQVVEIWQLNPRIAAHKSH